MAGCRAVRVCSRSYAIYLVPSTVVLVPVGASLLQLPHM